MIRIGNASGFHGDRLGAVREMLEGGELDVLTGAMPGLGFCLVARRRHREGVDVTAVGSIGQAFAGLPGEGRVAS